MSVYRTVLSTLAAVAVFAAAMMGMLVAAPADALAQASITNVTSQLPNGQYASGNTIAIDVVFDAVVEVSGKPRFQLETGSTDRYARYSTGTGTNTLIFNYIVLDGDLTNDLAYISASIDLVGGSITSGGQPVNLALPASPGPGSLVTNKDIAVDATGAGNSVNLALWTKEGPSANGNWVVAGDGQSVTQTLNGNPTFFVSNFNVSDSTFEGTFKCTTTNDDDIMGFVFGFQDASTSGTSGHFYVFDWKKAGATFGGTGYDTQTGTNGHCYPGGRILKVNGTYSLQSMWVGEDHVPSDPLLQDQVFTLAENAPSNGTGPSWVTNVSYRFKLTFKPGDIRVEVWRVSDNLKIFDLATTDSTFTDGKVGFYNYSQDQVNYSGFTFKFAPPPMTPLAAKQAQALDVVFTGEGFTPQTTVDFGSNDVFVTSMTYLNDRTIVAAVQVAPDAILGPRTVSIVQGGVSTPLNQHFTINGHTSNTHTITVVEPDKLYPGGTYTVSILGDNFANDSAVSMGADVQVLSTEVLSDSLISVTARPTTGSTGGTRFVTIQSTFTGTTVQQGYEVAKISTFSQSNTVAGGSGVGTVTGFGFQDGMTVYISPLVTIDAIDVVSSQLMTFDYTIAPVAACGTLNLMLSDGVGSVSQANAFVVDESDTGPPLPPANGCSVQTSSDHTYLSCTTTLRSYPNAKQACLDWDGYLAAVGSSAEQTLLGPGSNFQGQKWIGLSDEAVEGAYVWENGEALGYTAWCSPLGSPSGATADCVHINTSGGNGCWDDNLCSNTYPFICEKDASSVALGTPTPTVIPSVLGTGVTLDVTLRGYTPICTGSTAAFGTGITVNGCVAANAHDLVCNISVLPSASAGSRDIVIDSSVTGADMTVFDALTLFRINGITPGSIAQGETKTFTINGAGFLPAATVAFENASLSVTSVTYVSSTQLLISATASSMAQLGLYDLLVTNGSGSPAVLANAVTVTLPGGLTPPPTLTTVIPSKGSPGTNLLVRVMGSNFTLGSTVTMGSGITMVDCDTITSVEVRCIIAIASNATLGFRNVGVTTQYGSATLTNGFKVSDFTISAVTPDSVPVGFMGIVDVTGFGFTNDLDLDFGSDVTVISIIVNSETSAFVDIAVSPTALPGPRDVNGLIGAEGATLPGGLTLLLDAPIIAGIQPSYVSPGSSILLTISGQNFVPNASVSLVGGPSGPVLFDSSTQLRVPYVAPTTPQVTDVGVTTGAGSTTAAGALTIYGIASLTPISLAPGDTLPLSLTGVGFQGDEVVSFGPQIGVSNKQQAVNDVTVDVTPNLDAPLGSYPTSVISPSLGLTHSVPQGVTVLPPGTWDPPDPNVPAGCVAVTYQFKPYAVCPTPLSWADAQASCQTTDMHLVKVSHVAENTFVIGQFGANNLSASWIGAHDVGGGVYQWADGTPVAGGYANWLGGQPTSEFGYLMPTGQWSTAAGGTQSYVCEGNLPPAPPLVGYWRLDDGLGSAAADASGNGLTAQVLGAPLWVQSTLGASLPNTPSTGAAIDFTPNAFAQATVPFSLDTGLTMEVWLDLPASGANSQDFEVGLYELGSSVAAAPTCEMTWTNTTGGDATVAVTCDFGSGPITAQGAVTHPAGWVHLAATYDGADLIVYFDGAEVDSQALTGSIGGGPFAYRFGEGEPIADEVLLWSIALDPTTIGEHADTGDVPEGLPLPALGDTAPHSIGRGQSRAISLIGANFTTDMTVDFGPGIVVSSLTIHTIGTATALISADAHAALGFRNVRVTTSYGVAVLPSTFLVYGLNGVSPSVIQVGTPNQTVELSGYGLSAGDTFAFGGGITVNSVTCTSTRRCQVNLDVAAGLPLGSRSISATDASGSVGILAGLLTISGPNVIVWTTRPDFTGGSWSSLDLDSKPGSAFLAKDNGFRACPFTSGPCSDHVWVSGAGTMHPTYGAGGATFSGYGGGFLDIPLPTGELDLSATISNVSVTSSAMEVFGLGPASGFAFGSKYTAAGHIGVVVTGTSNVIVYRNGMSGLQYWNFGTSAWVASPTGASLPAQLRILATRRGATVGLVLANAATSAIIAEISDTGISGITHAYLGSRAELDNSDQPQFGTFKSGMLSIQDPWAFFDRFGGTFTTFGYANWDLTSLSGDSFGGGSAGGAGAGLTIDYGMNGSFIALDAPASDNWTMRTRIAATGATATGPIPFFNLFDEGSLIGGPEEGEVHSTLAFDPTLGALMWFENDGSDNLSYWNGALWTTTPSIIAGSQTTLDTFFLVELRSTDSGFSAQVYDDEGILLASLDSLPIGMTETTFACGAIWPAEGGGTIIDFLEVEGDISGPGYRRQGTLTVDPYDAGDGIAINWGVMGLGAALPTDTTVSLRARSADTLAALLAMPFTGPDGTANTSFAGGEVIGAPFDGHRYLQWQGTFETSNLTETPEMLDVIIPIQEIPTIASVSPPFGNPGQTLSLTIMGTAFDSSSTVQLGSGITVNSVTVVSQNELTVSISIGGATAPGMRDVTVSTSAGSATLVNGFGVAGATGITPGEGSQGDSGLGVTISGLGFTPAVTASFGAGVSVVSLTFVSSTQLDAILDIASNSPLGARDVSVTSSGFTSTLDDAFTVLPAPGCTGCDTLTLTSVAPRVLDRDTPNALTLHGTGFAAVMTLGGGAYLQLTNFTVVSDTQATVTATVINGPPIGHDHVLSLAWGAQSTTASIDVLDIGSTNVPLIPAGSFAALTAAGDGFDGGFAPTVSLSDPALGLALNGYTNTSLAMTVTVPANAPLGTRDLFVQVGAADAFKAGALKVVGDSENSLPLLASLSPSEGIRGTTLQVTAFGQNFTLDTDFDCGVGIFISNVIPLSSTQATFTMFIAPGANSGFRTCSVTTEFGAASLPNAFNVKTSICDGVVCNSPPGICYEPVGACNPANGSCGYSPKPAGAPCNDGIACTLGNACTGAGQCGTPSNLACNDGIPCTIDSCSPATGCSNLPDNPLTCDLSCPVGGDLNGSGQINVADIACAILLILNPGNPPACLAGPSAFADTNCSGSVNVSDIQLLISITLIDALPASIDRNVNTCHDQCEVPDCEDGICDSLGNEDCLLCPEDCGGCTTGTCSTAHVGAGCTNGGGEFEVQECVCDSLVECCIESSDWTQPCANLANGTCAAP